MTTPLGKASFREFAKPGSKSVEVRRDVDRKKIAFHIPLCLFASCIDSMSPTSSSVLYNIESDEMYKGLLQIVFLGILLAALRIKSG